jgi:hypothetical protein
MGRLVLGSAQAGTVVTERLADAVRQVVDRTQGEFRRVAEDVVGERYREAEASWPVDTGRSKRQLYQYSRITPDGAGYAVGWGIRRVSYLVFVFAPFRAVKAVKGAELRGGKFLPQAFRGLIQVPTRKQGDRVTATIRRDLPQRLG